MGRFRASLGTTFSVPCQNSKGGVGSAPGPPPSHPATTNAIVQNTLKVRYWPIGKAQVRVVADLVAFPKPSDPAGLWGVIHPGACGGKTPPRRVPLFKKVLSGPATIRGRVPAHGACPSERRLWRTDTTASDPPFQKGFVRACDHPGSRPRTCGARSGFRFIAFMPPATAGVRNHRKRWDDNRTHTGLRQDRSANAPQTARATPMSHLPERNVRSHATTSSPLSRLRWQLRRCRGTGVHHRGPCRKAHADACHQARTKRIF